jgi:hypothetical protein
VQPLLLAILGLTLASFATSAKASSTHFDPGYYRKHTCQQLLEEAQAASAKAIALSGEADKSRAASVASTADVVVIPHGVSDEKSVSNEIGLVKQQLLAIEDASIQSQCDIEFLYPNH